MQEKLLKRFSAFVIASTAATALLLGGCEGDRGPRGAQGPAGTGAFTNLSSSTADQQANITFDQQNSTVNSVTIKSPPVVTFTLKTANGQPVEGIGRRNASGQLTNLAFTIAKLVPASNGTPSHWVSYIVTTAPTDGSAPSATRPTRDREGTLESLGNGKFRYTFARDIKLVQSQVNAMTFSGNNRRNDLGDLTYDPSLTHRLVIEYGGNIANTSPQLIYKNAINIVYDFVPATGARVTSSTTGQAERNIVLTKYCNECHGNPGDPNDLNQQGWGLGITTPHAGRVDTRYCVVCHTSQRAYGRAISTPTNGAFTGNTYVTADTTTVDPGSATDEVQVLGEFVTLIHKIHMGENLTETGYNYAGIHFNEVAYPESAALCRKCHRGETAQQLAVTPQGDNWRTMPNRKACGSCHDNIHFATGTNTTGPAHPVYTNDASCNACHTPTAITESHAQALVSPLNPAAPAGLTNFEYQLSSATVDGSNNLTIKFRILGNGTPITLATPAAGLTTALTGFTGSPSFLLAYAKPQLETGGAVPADYNNLGKVAAQPDLISITTLLNTNNAAVGNITGPDSSGTYTATINSASAFPVGAQMRAVGIQSYFTQTGFDASIAGRHTRAVIIPVTGDAVRRTVVDPDKCRNCHEFFEAHGGQRVYQTQLCVTCHNPNLTTSGRTITDAKLAGFAFTPIQLGILTTWDPNFATNRLTPGYALTLPEFSNNFKDLIHGIHAGATRTNPIRDVRNGPGTGVTLIEGSEITFPNMLGNCDACHITQQSYTPDVIEALRPRALPSTQAVADGAIPTTATINAARATVPNATDLVVAPVTAACVACHDTPLAKAHMNANGAQLGAALAGPSNTNMGVARSTLPSATEQCTLCHGQGRVADVIIMHGQNRPQLVPSSLTTGSSAARMVKLLLNW
ncbi:OmcA/MtrC family decaheme c-type cytochrome [Geomonas anaerohicana]|uniref:OmcA/MtrC family decaheme c-type cytochrome n=1 Tax=Geomonas anaerohicana TaxID=2798583 RepID=A0ABS0YK13_9BACT|nr:OmcA/MtrC family decaheme c-type cytochrome [Geomonas anaerohicana]MBJ6752601.1 OmcA/MtrC family decaheme c-type cytochrome [Geomonas anaerohicana]